MTTEPVKMVNIQRTIKKKLDNISALNDGDLMETDLFNLQCA